MDIVKDEPFENIEIDYNHNYIPVGTEKYEYDFTMHPFVYEHIDNRNVRKLVIMWNASIKIVDVDILNFQLDDPYIIDKSKGNRDIKEFCKKIIEDSYKKTALKYYELSNSHEIQFRGFSNFNMDYHFSPFVEQLMELLYVKWID